MVGWTCSSWRRLLEDMFKRYKLGCNPSVSKFRSVAVVLCLFALWFSVGSRSRHSLVCAVPVIPVVGTCVVMLCGVRVRGQSQEVGVNWVRSEWSRTQSQGGAVQVTTEWFERFFLWGARYLIVHDCPWAKVRIQTNLELWEWSYPLHLNGFDWEGHTQTCYTVRVVVDTGVATVRVVVDTGVATVRLLQKLQSHAKNVPRCTFDMFVSGLRRNTWLSDFSRMWSRDTIFYNLPKGLNLRQLK